MQAPILIVTDIYPLLAQAAPAAPVGQGTDAQVANPAAPPFWSVLLDQSLLIVLFFIFLTAIVTVIVEQRRRDKCLKLMHEYHATFTDTAGRVLWGDVLVYANALELVFDEPYTNKAGITKSSAMLYADSVGQTLAICRPVQALTESEKRKRDQQIRQRFRPGAIRRFLRSLRNMLNTLRDAFGKAFSTVLAAVIAKRPGVTGGTQTTMATTVAGQQAQVDTIGQKLITAAGNTYEPMLERHIGRPVVLRLNNVTADPPPAEPHIELPGFLLDYTDKWVAIANLEHEGSTEVTMTLTRDEPAQTSAWLDASLSGVQVKLRNVSREPLLIQRIVIAGASAELLSVLLPGASIQLHAGSSELVVINAVATRRLDVCAPRNVARILFGGSPQEAERHNVAKPALQTDRDDGVAPPVD